MRAGPLQGSAKSYNEGWSELPRVSPRVPGGAHGLRETKAALPRDPGLVCHFKINTESFCSFSTH